MAVTKITTPVSGNGVVSKINEIITLLGQGDIKTATLKSNKLTLTKVDGTSFEIDFSSFAAKASATQDGLLSKENFLALENIKSSMVNDKISVAMVIPYATCSTDVSTMAKVATVQNGVTFTLKKGAMIMVEFSSPPYITGSKTETLNVNGTGAKTITYAGLRGGYYTPASGTDRLLFVYDGTYWVCITAYNYSYSEDSGGS